MVFEPLFVVIPKGFKSVEMTIKPLKKSASIALRSWHVAHGHQGVHQVHAKASRLSQDELCCLIASIGISRVSYFPQRSHMNHVFTYGQKALEPRDVYREIPRGKLGHQPEWAGVVQGVSLMLDMRRNGLVPCIDTLISISSLEFDARRLW